MVKCTELTTHRAPALKSNSKSGSFVLTHMSVSYLSFCLCLQSPSFTDTTEHALNVPTPNTPNTHTPHTHPPPPTHPHTHTHTHTPSSCPHRNTHTHTHTSHLIDP